MIEKDSQTGFYVFELEKSPVLDFEFSDDSYFRVDFDEEIDFIPVEARFVYNDLQGKNSIDAYLVRVEYRNKNTNNSFGKSGKYRCKYSEF